MALGTGSGKAITLNGAPAFAWTWGPWILVALAKFSAQPVGSRLYRKKGTSVADAVTQMNAIPAAAVTADLATYTLV